MSPVIEDGDRVLIVPVDAKRLHPGVIVKCVTSDGFRLHRLIQRARLADKGWNIRLAGDNADEPDPWLGEDAVVGVAVAVERDGVVRRFDTPGARWKGALTAWRRRRRLARAVQRSSRREQAEAGDQRNEEDSLPAVADRAVRGDRRALPGDRTRPRGSEE
jgi:hypothetical protein